MSTLITQDFFKGDAIDVARALLGMRLEFNGNSGIIVETEAYKNDGASHGYRLTPRSEIMLRTHGYVYVYFIYGMYHCLNFTTNEGNIGAVLIRALEPLYGGYRDMSGPGKLCRQLGITKAQNNKMIGEEIKLYHERMISSRRIVVCPRIGIKKDAYLPWRFYVKGNKFVSVI